jgi:hypothetical protein
VKEKQEGGYFSVKGLCVFLFRQVPGHTFPLCLLLKNEIAGMFFFIVLAFPICSLLLCEMRMTVFLSRSGKG